MQLPNFDDTDLAIVGIVLLLLIGAGILAFVKQPGAAIGTVLATAITAVGSLAGGRKQKVGGQKTNKVQKTKWIAYQVSSQAAVSTANRGPVHLPKPEL
jgi:hypothetical protein